MKCEQVLHLDVTNVNLNLQIHFILRVIRDGLKNPIAE